MFSNIIKSGMGMSLVRHALTWGSGVLVAKGTISADVATQMVSLAVGIAGLLLSAQDKTSKVAQFSGLEKTVTELTEKEQQERSDWLKVQQELSELRAENEQQRKQLAEPTLELRADELRRSRPQARYEHVSLAKNSGFMLSEKSRQKLAGVHPLLAAVVETAMGMSEVDFTVTEGVRSAARQEELLASGRSWVKTSKHQVDPETNLGHAVDVMALPTPNGSWDWEYYEQINDAMQAAAKIHNARVTWGGCWAVRDGCHFQLDGETK